MTRKKTVHQIQGVNDTNESRIPGWVGRLSDSNDESVETMAIREWQEEVTEHEVVEVAYGTGNTSKFQKSSDTKMVIDADTQEEVASVSNRFNLVENDEVVRAAADVIDNFNLSGAVYGEARDFQDMMVLDLYFDVNEVTFENPDTQDVLAAGIELQAANDGSSSVKVRPIIRDGYCRNTMRGLSDWSKMSHIKGEDDEHQTHYDKIYKMVAEAVFGLGWLSNTLLRDVELANDFLVDFSEHPFTLGEFYEEFLPSTAPDKVITTATSRAIHRQNPDAERLQNDDSVTVSMWAIVSGATYALTHESNMRDGSNKDRFYRPLRDALSNPESAFNTVRVTLKNQNENEVTSEESVKEKAATIENEFQKLRNQ